MENNALQRISKMESYLNECTEATSNLADQLDRMEDIRDHMTELFSYYGSDEWYEDCELELPENMPAGVLSEDLVYDQITAVRDAAIRMLELSTDILKNRI